MHVEAISDRARIQRLLRQDASLHLYELGDLDDFFFPFTSYRALVDDGEIRMLGLFYTGSDLPVLVAMGHPRSADVVRAFLREVRGELPPRVYAHLSPGTHDAFGDAFALEHHGLHDRMVLVDRAKIASIDTSAAESLGPGDRAEIDDLFARAYPGNWFVSRMLETNSYFGVRREGALVAIAGVHVVAREIGVAALGNITTDPAHRGRGLGKVVTAAVCKALAEHADPIGLNVESTNEAAIALYRSLGFERIASYEEILVTRKGA